MSTSQSDPGLPAAIDQQNKKFTTIIIYPTGKTLMKNSKTGKHNHMQIYCAVVSVTPEKIIIPMVSCILGFPLLALMVICCLRRRAKLARDRDRRRNLGWASSSLTLLLLLRTLCASTVFRKYLKANNAVRGFILIFIFCKQLLTRTYGFSVPRTIYTKPNVAFLETIRRAIDCAANNILQIHR